MNRLLSVISPLLLLAITVLAQAQGAGVEVGDRAPDFQLQGSDGKVYSLSQFLGKKPIVIAWFPKAFTRG